MKRIWDWLPFGGAEAVQQDYDRVANEKIIALIIHNNTSCTDYAKCKVIAEQIMRELTPN